MNDKNQKIYLIDGLALCYRAFYAIKELSTSKGMPTNAIYGFVTILRRILREYSPEILAVVFDMKAPTKRHKMYKEYKIHRKPMPEDLVVQIPRIKELLEAYRIPVYELEGYEADDIIATLAERAKCTDMDITIVTSDKDALQLIDENVKVLSPQTGKDKVYRAEEVEEKYGVEPASMVELMSLMGDQSDNVPGVKGIGKVTAAKLVTEYGCVEGIYANIDKISSKSVKEKLENGKEMVKLSHDLVVLDRDVPIKVDLKKIKIEEPDTERLVQLFGEFEFDKWLREVMPKEENRKEEYSVAEDAGKIDKVIGEISKKKICAFSLVAQEQNKVLGVAFSCGEGEAVFLSMKDDTNENIKKILEEPSIAMVGFDIKNDLRLLRRCGIELKGADFDVMVADYLIDPSNTKYDISSVSMRHLGYGIADDGTQLQWSDSGQGEMDLSVSSTDGYEAACRKSDIVLRLFNVLKPVLSDKGLYDLFSEVEMPLVNVLADMEEKGVKIDREYLEKQSIKIGKKLEQVSKKIYDEAGEEFNINSPKQLQVVLYDNLELPVLKKTKTGRSTDESVLRQLAEQHELPKKLLEYRELNKLKTAYYDSIGGLVDPKTSKLHAYFNQCVTATGRLSSSEPNLQNIPIKTTLGKEIRRAFIPSKKNMVLLAVDYSQVELRVLAHLSEDKDLINAFNDEEDVHVNTASQIFGCAPEKVLPEMRSVAKTVNFGIVYGISAFGLAKELNVRVDEAQDFIDAYFKRYKGVQKYIDKTIAETRKTGFVATILNRRRYIPEINSSNERIRSFAERTAINTPVQGSAADLIKLAMIEWEKEFQDGDPSMIIQVHDELVFEAAEKKIKPSAKKVKEIMENVIVLKVPIKVDVEYGPNWMDMKELEL